MKKEINAKNEEKYERKGKARKDEIKCFTV